MAVKGISKSVRITDEVYGYIMDAPGNGFNEKFENIILEAKKGEARRRKELAELQVQVDGKRREMLGLCKRYGYLEDFYRTAVRMQRQLHDLGMELERAAGVQEMKEGDRK